MKCYYHPAQDSVHGCTICRKFLCPACAHSIKSRIYCQDCLVAGAELAALATSPQLATHTPARAALFGVFPGIGAVYNREYTKALLHFSVFAGLVLLADAASPIFGLGAFVFYIYTIVDAYRSAQVILRRHVSRGEMLEEESAINASLWAGVLMFGLGILFFLNNLGVNAFAFLGKLWPLAFVALGIYLILDYFRKSREPSTVEPRGSTSPAERTAAESRGEESRS